jgi:hypothetical protein
MIHGALPPADQHTALLGKVPAPLNVVVCGVPAHSVFVEQFPFAVTTPGSKETMCDVLAVNTGDPLALSNGGKYEL